MRICADTLYLARYVMRRSATLTLAALFLLARAAASDDPRPSLLPKLQPGQSLTYLVHWRGDKNVKTESSFALPMAPAPSLVDALALLRIEILEVQHLSDRLAVHAKAQFVHPPSTARPATHESNFVPQNQKSPGKFIEFTIALDGSADKIIGLDALGPDEQRIWEAWVARFAAAWTIPRQRARIGEKWKGEQLEPASSPIAALMWVRDSVYVRNEPCRAAQLSSDAEVSPPSGSADTCAVLLTTAKLVQNSSSKDATPEEFKLRELKTMGTANGANEIITYISLTTGIVVRATEEANQQMDVIVAKANASNGVHYTVTAKSQSEVLLVADTPPSRP